MILIISELNPKTNTQQPEFRLEIMVNLIIASRTKTIN